ncbi:MAG: hypothetical protein ABIB43_02790, partial [archaeon]
NENKKDKKQKEEKKKETEGKKEEKELTSDQIFKELAELAGESHEKVKKVVDKAEVSSKDIISIFANTTNKKQMDANVFKAILSQLLQSGKVSKHTVSEILFEFLDNELLTKKEVSGLIRYLKLTSK